MIATYDQIPNVRYDTNRILKLNYAITSLTLLSIQDTLDR